MVMVTYGKFFVGFLTRYGISTVDYPPITVMFYYKYSRNFDNYPAGFTQYLMIVFWTFALGDVRYSSS